jgi:hypothetical protein
MKKLNFRHLLGVALVATVISACEKNPMGDEPISTEPGFAKISLTKKDNTFLDKDYVGEVGSGVTFYVAPAFKDSTKYVFDYILSNADLIFFNDDTLSYGETVTLKETNSFKLINTLDEKTVEYPLSMIYTDNEAALSKVFVEKVAYVSDSLQTLVSYNVDEITSKMSLGLPAELKGKSVIVKLDATIDDVIKVDGEVYKDSLVFDTTFPCEIEVKDTVMNKTATYTLSVSNGTLTLDWVKVSSNMGLELADTYFDVAIDAATGNPYIAYLTTDGSTTTKYAAVAKYDIATAKSDTLGSKFLTKDGKGANMAIDVVDGNPAVFSYVGSSTGSIFMYENSAWKTLCTDIDKGTGLSKYQNAMVIDPATKYPVFATTSNNKSFVGGQRGANVSFWNGSAYKTNQTLPGRATDDKGYAFTPRMARTADGIYLLYANQTLKSYSLYKFASNAWTEVIKEFVIYNQEVGTVQMSLKADRKGNVYALIADNATGNWLVGLYKFEGNTFKKMGNYIPNFICSNSSSQIDLSFDAADNPVAIYIDAVNDNAVKMVSFDLANKAWGPTFDTGETKANYRYVCMDNDANGNVYVVYSVTTDNSKVHNLVLWKGTTKK